MDNNEYTLGVYLDLAKAFDIVNHEILLRKLDHYGMRGIVNEWFKNYWTERKQILKYKSQQSESLAITCGVPQGSVLAPLLFLIYMNDISRCSKRLSFILFADDTNLFYSHKNVDILYLMNQELENITSWLSCNKLSLNVKKTHFMVFKTKRKKLDQALEIKINNRQIDKVKYTKFLRLYIDDELSWRKHIDQISTIKG